MGSWDDLQLHDDIVGYILLRVDMRWQIMQKERDEWWEERWDEIDIERRELARYEMKFQKIEMNWEEYKYRQVRLIKSVIILFILFSY